MDFDIRGSSCEKAEEVQIRREPNTLGRMHERAKKLEDELAAIKEAVSILEKHPDIQRLLTLMQKMRM